MAFNFLNKDGLTYFWNKIKARIGTATLTTTAQDLSGAVNELNSKLGNSLTFTPNSEVTVTNQSIGAFNNMAYGTIEAKLTAAQSTWVAIGTISKCPAQMATFPCLRTGNGTFSGMVQITTAGIVQLYSTQALSGNAIAFSFNYSYTN
jgi:hypothetical protein